LNHCTARWPTGRERCGHDRRGETPATESSDISSVRSCWKPMTSARTFFIADAAEGADGKRQVGGFDGQSADGLNGAGTP